MNVEQDVTTIPYRLLSKREVAAMLGRTTRTIDRLVATKKIPYIEVPTGVGSGTRVGFLLQEILTWLKGASVVSVAAPAAVAEGE